MTNEHQAKLQEKLRIAIEDHNLDEIRHAIRDGADVNKPLKEDTLLDGGNAYPAPVNPLQYAVRSRSLPAVKLLLELGGNVNHQQPVVEDTPLHCSMDNFNITKELLESGADVNVRNFFGQTPLHIAASNQKSSIIKLLLTAGARTDVHDNDNFIPENKTSSRSASESLLQNAQKGTRPTPEEAGLDIERRNKALQAINEGLNLKIPERKDIKGTTQPNDPLSEMSPEEIIRRQQQQALENDEGI